MKDSLVKTLRRGSKGEEVHADMSEPGGDHFAARVNLGSATMIATRSRPTVGQIVFIL